MGKTAHHPHLVDLGTLRMKRFERALQIPEHDKADIAQFGLIAFSFQVAQ